MIKEKQVDATENKLKAEKNDGKTKFIVYLKEEIEKKFQLHPESFNKRSKLLLKKLAINGNKINYINLSYKICFNE